MASNIQSNLVEMVGQLKPGQVVPENAVRNALGIPVSEPANQQTPMEIE